MANPEYNEKKVISRQKFNALMYKAFLDGKNDEWERSYKEHRDELWEEIKG